MTFTDRQLRYMTTRLNDWVAANGTERHVIQKSINEHFVENQWYIQHNVSEEKGFEVSITPIVFESMIMVFAWAVCPELVKQSTS